MRKFGVSGYLYQSDVLLWDNCGESFWSQIEGKAVAGPETDTELEWLQVVDTTFEAFKKDHPKGEVLKGPHPRRAYKGNPYKGYEKVDKPGIHRGGKADKRMHQKAVVTGIMVGTTAYCIPHETIKKVETPLTVKLDDRTLTITYDRNADVVTVTESVKVAPKKGEKSTDSETKKVQLVTMRAFWFAWVTFHSDTELFEITKEMKLKEVAPAENEKKGSKPTEKDEGDF